MKISSRFGHIKKLKRISQLTNAYFYASDFLSSGIPSFRSTSQVHERSRRCTCPCLRACTLAARGPTQPSHWWRRTGRRSWRTWLRGRWGPGTRPAAPQIFELNWILILISDVYRNVSFISSQQPTTSIEQFLLSKTFILQCITTSKVVKQQHSTSTKAFGS